MEAGCNQCIASTSKRLRRHEGKGEEKKRDFHEGFDRIEAQVRKVAVFLPSSGMTG